MTLSFNRVLTLQAKTLTPDTGGGYAESWNEAAPAPTVHAAVVAVSGGKQEQAGQSVALQRFKISTRYRSDILPEMRFVEGNLIYRILAVSEPDGRKKMLEISAEGGGA